MGKLSKFFQDLFETVPPTVITQAQILFQYHPYVSPDEQERLEQQFRMVIKANDGKRLYYTSFDDFILTPKCHRWRQFFMIGAAKQRYIEGRKDNEKAICSVCDYPCVLHEKACELD